jgi:metal-responsive CopG/Arc/MetJ family transcriptional regulator
MPYVHVGARVPSELAEKFDLARRIDRRNRSAALRLAMEGYIAQIADPSAINDERPAYQEREAPSVPTAPEGAVGAR